MSHIFFDRIDHVAAGVKDLDVDVAWWRDNFGFVREIDFGIAETGSCGVFLRSGAIRIELIEPANAVAMPAGRRDVMGGAKVASTTSRFRWMTKGALGELQSRRVEVVYPNHGPVWTLYHRC